MCTSKSNRIYHLVDGILTNVLVDSPEIDRIEVDARGRLWVLPVTFKELSPQHALSLVHADFGSSFDIFKTGELYHIDSGRLTICIPMGGSSKNIPVCSIKWTLRRMGFDVFGIRPPIAEPIWHTLM